MNKDLLISILIGHFIFDHILSIVAYNKDPETFKSLLLNLAPETVLMALILGLLVGVVTFRYL
jgi:hypothetical protein